MEVIGSTELVGSYWYKKDDMPFEFTIYDTKPTLILMSMSIMRFMIMGEFC